jgi:hypothetical protein
MKDTKWCYINTGDNSEGGCEDGERKDSGAGGARCY